MAKVTIALLGVALLAGAPAFAQDARKDVGPRGGVLVQMDMDFGGDDIATIYFEDDESQDVKAGNGLVLSVGGYFRPIESSPFAIDASVGYKFTTTRASNADIHVTRTLLQLGARYQWDSGFYLRGGLTQHLDPHLNGDGFFDDVSFDDATGLDLELGWRWIGLHYVDIDYSNDFGEVDASHIGLRFTWRSGQRWF